MNILLILIAVCDLAAGDDLIDDKSLIKVTRKVRQNLEFENPCDYMNYPKPDFSAPGRRISEEKCNEYIWEIKKREQISQRFINCSKRLRKQGLYFVLGGRSTKPSEFPHMGAVGWRAAVGTWIFKCGSSLISSKYLLTAAHCSKLPSRDTSVANPVPKIFANDVAPQVVLIKRILNHPNFSPPRKYFDIAIIEVTKEVHFTMLVQPACLWSKYDTRELGTKATLTGWGVVEKGGKAISPELQAAEVDLISSDLCQRLLFPYFNRLWFGVRKHQLCAGNLTGGVDACQGDSGGPLQVKIPLRITSQVSIHYVIGVTSFGIGCAHPNIPGIYTRVASFIDWIEDVVWRGL